MNTPERILVAQPVDPGGLRRARAIAGDATVECIAPLGADHVVTDEQARETTILFSDQCPANVADMHRLAWVQLGSHGFSQLNDRVLPPGVVVTNASGVNDIPSPSGAC